MLPATEERIDVIVEVDVSRAMKELVPNSGQKELELDISVIEFELYPYAFGMSIWTRIPC